MSLSELAADLLHGLSHNPLAAFNVFSVMHHGRHEKQLSNVFAWLLTEEGSHGLGPLAVEAFVAEVNANLPPAAGAPIGRDRYKVTQEENTSDPGVVKDIADILMVGNDVAIIIENYFVSDPHDHGYGSYLRRAASTGKRPIVVLLCQTLDESRMGSDWRDASVVTYAGVLRRLMASLAHHPEYEVQFPAQHWFLRQIYDFFVKGQPVSSEIIAFLVSMCDSGEAGRYRGNHELEAAKLGEALKVAAVERFGQGRDLLKSIKKRLRHEIAPTLLVQLNQGCDRNAFGSVTASSQGIYEWSINFSAARPAAAGAEQTDDPGDQALDAPGQLQIKFGPSAWFANAKDDYWTTKVTEPDYGRLFLTWQRAVYQSAVTLSEVAQEPPDDLARSLCDEILAIIER